MNQPMPYTYTDPSDDTLTIGRTNNVASLKAQQGDQATDIHVLPEDVEQVVAAIRTAAGAQQPEPEERRARYANTISISGGDYDAADAVMAVADEEQRELIARLGQYADRGIANGQEADRLRAELEQARNASGCAWPGCVSEAEQQQLAADVLTEMRGSNVRARTTTGQDTTPPADGEQEIRQQIAWELDRLCEIGAVYSLDDAERRRIVAAVLPVVRAAMADAQENLAFVHRVTIPELRREVERHADGKQRWRGRAEKAEAALAGVLRIVSDVTTKANDFGGVDINDLVTRLGQAGHPLPDDEEQPA